MSSVNVSTGWRLPDRKIWASGLAGIATWLAALALERWAGIVIPAEVLGPIIVAVAGSVGYMVPPSVRDFLDRLDAAVTSAALSPAVGQAEPVLLAGERVKQAVKVAERVADWDRPRP